MSVSRGVNLIYFVWVYLLILGFHFGYAVWLLKKNPRSMVIGPIRSHFTIRLSLLILNSISLSVFAFPSPKWIQGNLVLQIALTLDEVLRVRKSILRLPFLVNHVLWAGLLFSSILPLD